MKKPPRGMKDSLERRNAGNKVLIPVSILIFVFSFFNASDLIIRVIIGGTIGYLGYCIFQHFRGYRKELHGKDLKKFKKLNRELFACANVEDLLGVVYIIEQMSRLMKTDFRTAHRCLQWNSFTFGSPQFHLESMFFLVQRVEEMKEVQLILHMDEERLPVFLTSSYDYVRQAAMARMFELQKEDGGEGTSDLP